MKVGPGIEEDFGHDLPIQVMRTFPQQGTTFSPAGREILRLGVSIETRRGLSDSYCPYRLPRRNSVTSATGILQLLEEYPTYRHLLFRRGYLITDDANVNTEEFPFYGEWKTAPLGTIDGRATQIHHHPDQRLASMSDSGNLSIAIIGHAYNPFTMESEEMEIMRGLLSAWREGSPSFFSRLNELSGIHLIVVHHETGMLAVQDCAGLQACYFGRVGGYLYMTSHPQLVGDICELTRDPFVEKLIASRPYRIGNRHLPADNSPYTELKRLGGNCSLSTTRETFHVERFFPGEHDQASVVSSKNDVDSVVAESALILQRSLRLITEKWPRPAISLTGGTDSKTTLACASDQFDDFKYFSYHAKAQEEVDARAAREVCNSLALTHLIYEIPPSNNDIADFDVLKAIIDHNTSHFVQLADNELRKMVALMRLNEFDVEVKSWASEIVRVFFERKYDTRMPEVLSPRHFSIFQTRYFGDRRLLKESDRRYRNFMHEIGLDRPSGGYEHSDLYYWELRMSAWGSSIVSAFDFCHQATVPFNNRNLIKLFLRLPRDMRKTDTAHRAIMELMEPRVASVEEVRNLYFHRYRVILEKAFYLYRTIPGNIRSRFGRGAK